MLERMWTNLNLVHYWWECNMVKLLQKTVQQILNK